MSGLSLGEFSNRVSELMPVISRQFLKYQTSDFYKMKITLPQFVMLDIIARHGELCMSELAHHMNVTTAAITGIVDRLVRDSYIVRTSDPKDRRIVRVKLTAKGASIVHKTNEQRKKMMMDMFEVISQEEREEYLKILMHIRDHIAGKNH
jgi:DNA-binding MarR family transcriptional regulator